MGPCMRQVVSICTCCLGEGGATGGAAGDDGLLAVMVGGRHNIA